MVIKVGARGVLPHLPHLTILGKIGRRMENTSGRMESSMFGILFLLGGGLSVMTGMAVLPG